MNLVAKEFVASRPDEDGVLVLSQFAGAALELSDAVLFNPYAIDELADAIRQAVEMPQAERKKRMQRMRSAVQDNNVYRWAGKILSALLKFDMPDAPASAPPGSMYRPVLQSSRTSGRRSLSLSCSGTVTVARMVDRSKKRRKSRTTFSASSRAQPGVGNSGFESAISSSAQVATWSTCFGRVHKERDLEIQEEAAHVHVRRSDHGEAVVEEDGLGMEHHGFVEQDAAAGGVQVAKVAGAGEIGRDVVRSRGHDQADVNAAPGCQAQCPGQHFVGNVIGRDDPDSRLRREDQSQQGFVERIARDVGAAGDDLNRGRLEAGGAGLGVRDGPAAGSLPVANFQSDAKSESSSATAGPSTTTDRSCQSPARTGRADVRPRQIHAAGQGRRGNRPPRASGGSSGWRGRETG